MRVIFHPLFLVVIGLAVWMGAGLYALFAIIAVLIHESAHAIVANRYGVRATKITLLPFGAAVNIDCAFLPRGNQVAILLAGSFANMAVSVIAIAVVWIVPSLFNILGLFILTNFSVAFLNLMPLYPLDGGKIIALSSHRAIVRTLLFISNAFFTGLFLLALFWIQSWVVAILAAGMLFQINSESKNRYVSKLCKSLSDKSGRVREIAIRSDMTLFDVYKMISHKNYTKFIVTDKDNAVLFESDVESMLGKNMALDTKIVDII